MVEGIVLYYDDEINKVYIDICPKFDPNRFFNTSKIDFDRYIEEIDWDYIDTNLIIPEQGDIILFEYCEEGNIMVLYLKRETEVFKFIRYGHKTLLIHVPE